MKIKFLKNNKHSGFVMLFAVFLSMAILSITMGVLNVSLKEINFSSSGKDTNEASLAADLGVECALYNDKSTLNKFPIPYAVTTLSNCAGIAPASFTGSNTGASTVSYDFVLSGLGSSGAGCAKVNVSKDSSVPETIIISKGYNIGNSSCVSSNPNRLEREYEVHLGGVLTPPAPPVPPGNKGLFSTFAGSGAGTISSSPAGASCGTNCLSFANGTAITLTANPNGSSVFSGWGGDCAGMSCVLTMNSDRFISASFDLTSSPTPSYPTIAGTNSSFNNSDVTSHTVNLPSSISAGDLLIVLAEFDGNPTVTWPAGWVSLFSDSSSITDRFQGRYRIANGSEGATINLLTTGNAQQSVHQSFRITGYTGTPEVSAAAKDTLGTLTTPNSTNLTPSWGSQPTLWISAVGRGNGTSATNGYPSNYTNGTTTQTLTGLAGGSIDTARRNLTAASEDPGNFTLAFGQVWVAFTIAVQGSGAVVANNPPSANAGIDRSITLPTASSTPSGAGESDSDGTVVSRVWTYVAGSGPVTPTISNASTLSPTFSGMNQAGTYTFLLTVTDNDGDTGLDTMDVTVTAAAPTTYTVSGSAGANGNISPASQIINSGNTATLTVTPNSGYTASASGCGGSLVGTTYTTGSITGNCTVTATFTASAGGLIASYSMSEGSGVTTADGVGTNNGTLNNVTWTTGRYGNGLQFNNSGTSYVSLGNSSSLTPSTGLTVMAWVKTNNNAVSQWIVTKAPGVADPYYIRLQGTGNIRFSTKTGATEVPLTTTGGLIPTGVWKHVAGTWDGTTMRVYIDGIPVSSIAQSGVMTNTSTDVRIGGNTSGNLPFNGTIDDVKIYNYALTQAEINAAK